MIVKKITKAQGEFAKVNVDIKDGDIIKILDTGQIITGNFGDQYVFKIETASKEEKNLSFNQTSMNNLIEEFGEETDSWQLKSVKVWLITQSVAGQMKKVCYLTATNWAMSEDDKGNMTFIKSPTGGDDVPPPSKDEIDTEKIPF